MWDDNDWLAFWDFTRVCRRKPFLKPGPQVRNNPRGNGQNVEHPPEKLRLFPGCSWFGRRDVTKALRPVGEEPCVDQKMREIDLACPQLLGLVQVYQKLVVTCDTVTVVRSANSYVLHAPTAVGHGCSSGHEGDGPSNCTYDLRVEES